MEHDRDSHHIVGDHADFGLDACSLQSHHECENPSCQVRQVADLHEQLTAGQIKIGVITAVAGIVVSSIFAIAVLWVWVHHALDGHKMPDIPLIVATIASAPFAAGVITTLKIPRKAKVLLEQR